MVVGSIQQVIRSPVFMWGVFKCLLTLCFDQVMSKPKHGRYVPRYLCANAAPAITTPKARLFSRILIHPREIVYWGVYKEEGQNLAVRINQSLAAALNPLSSRTSLLSESVSSLKAKSILRTSWSDVISNAVARMRNQLRFLGAEWNKCSWCEKHLTAAITCCATLLTR